MSEESKSKQKIISLSIALVIIVVAFSLGLVFMMQQLTANNDTITSLRNENARLQIQVTTLNNQVSGLEAYKSSVEAYIANLTSYYETPSYSVGWVWKYDGPYFTLYTFVTNFGTNAGTVGLEIKFKEEDNIKSMDYKTLTVAGRTTVLSTWQYNFPTANIDDVDIEIKQPD